MQQFKILLLSSIVIFSTFANAENTSVNMAPIISYLLSDTAHLNLVKKTGQTTVYAPYDDGYYQVGVDPDYTRDDSKEIVKDNIIGVEWQDDAAVETVMKDWAEAGPYCTGLTLDGGGWRLPTIVELQSIVDDGEFGPSVDTTFINTTSYYYWSSTTHAYTTSTAWIVSFSAGHTFFFTETYTFHVRCVRAGH